jgi:hypothetical protein
MFQYEADLLSKISYRRAEKYGFAKCIIEGNTQYTYLLVKTENDALLIRNIAIGFCNWLGVTRGVSSSV